MPFSDLVVVPEFLADQSARAVLVRESGLVGPDLPATGPEAPHRQGLAKRRSDPPRDPVSFTPMADAQSSKRFGCGHGSKSKSGSTQ